MNKRSQNIQVPVIGGSLLLVIFAVLCLTVFALLGLSTVQADKRLSDISAKAVSDYYQADCLAEETLAKLRSGTVPEGVKEESGIYSYSCKISDTQALTVEIRGSDWKVLRWQAVSTIHWQEDDSMLIWDGKS